MNLLWGVSEYDPKKIMSVLRVGENILSGDELIVLSNEL